MNLLIPLQTERLALSSLTEADAPALHRQRSDEELMRYIPRVRTKNTEDALAMIRKISGSIDKNEALIWAIREKNRADMIGSIGLVHLYPENNSAELGYMLESPWHGKGLMSEAIQAVLAYAFRTLNLNRIEAITDPENHSSNRILERNGFIAEGILKENFLFEGRYLDSKYYALLKSQYLKTQA